MSATTKPTTRTCGPIERQVPAEQLKAEIERIVQQQSIMMWDLARRVGYSESVVRNRLLQLQDELRVHRVVSFHPVTNNRGYLWVAGPAPEPEIDDQVGPGEVPKQASRQKYPTVGRREYLVAALFGPARQDLPQGVK